MGVRRTFSPPKQFDDHSENLIKLLRDQKVTISVLDLDQNERDVVEQRQQRAERDAMKMQYQQFNARFAIEQAERYARYIQLLNVARGLYRTDMEMLAALAQFRRKPHRTATRTESTPPPSE